MLVTDIDVNFVHGQHRQSLTNPHLDVPTIGFEHLTGVIAQSANHAKTQPFLGCRRVWFALLKRINYEVNR